MNGNIQIIDKFLYPCCSLIFILLLGFPGYSLADKIAGDIVSGYGDIWVSKGLDDPWKKIQPGQALNTGEFIKTGRLSGASLLLQDESLIRLDQNSHFQVTSVQESSFWHSAASAVDKLKSGVSSSFRLISGRLWGRNNNEDVDTSISTLTATFGIRGTEYTIQADQNSSTATVLEGSVQAENVKGKITVNSGEQAVVAQDSAPKKKT